MTVSDEAGITFSERRRGADHAWMLGARERESRCPNRAPDTVSFCDLCCKSRYRHFLQLGSRCPTLRSSAWRRAKPHWPAMAVPPGERRGAPAELHTNLTRLGTRHSEAHREPPHGDARKACIGNKQPVPADLRESTMPSANFFRAVQIRRSADRIKVSCAVPPQHPGFRGNYRRRDGWSDRDDLVPHSGCGLPMIERHTNRRQRWRQKSKPSTRSRSARLRSLMHAVDSKLERVDNATLCRYGRYAP